MPNKNNIWWRSFNNPKLEEEKWLDPSDALFDKISDQVFEKKKKRRGFVFWFIGFGSFIGLLGLVFVINPFNANDSSLGEVPSEKSSNSTLEEIITNPSVDSPNPKSIASNQSLVNEAEKTTNKNDRNIDLKKPSQEKLSRVSDKIDNLSDVNESSISVSNAMAKTNFVVSSQQLQANNSRKFEAENTGFHIAPKPLSNPSIKNTISSNTTIDFLHSLALIKLSAFEFNRKLDLDLSDPFIPKKDPQSFNKKNTFGVTIGLSQWNFALNNEYANALNPADFTFDNDIKGWNLGLAYSRHVNQKLSVYTSLQLEKIKFNSGHNSSVNYDLNAESINSMSNQLDLMMASPLGFLESNLVINRGADAELSELDLILDLHNTHNVTNISLVSGLEYQIVKSSIIDVTVLSGIGLNYFSAISNDLTSFDIDRMGYGSGSTQINTNQQSVNKITPLTEIGISFNKELYKTFTTGFSIRHRKTLSPIYSEGNFSTNLSTFDVRWMISKSF